MKQCRDGGHVVLFERAYFRHAIRHYREDWLTMTVSARPERNR